LVDVEISRKKDLVFWDVSRKRTALPS
jgi:hypothetical protein